jgi:hypothetical protein
VSVVKTTMTEGGEEEDGSGEERPKEKMFVASFKFNRKPFQVRRVCMFVCLFWEGVDMEVCVCGGGGG